MIDRWWFKLAARLGRVHCLLDFYGDVQFYRIYLLWKEHVDYKVWTDWLPNAMLHIYPGEPGGEGPDGALSHMHPWSSLAFLLKNGYGEEKNTSGVVVQRNAPALSFMWWTDAHRLATVLPWTVSLFMHGWRRGLWRVKRKKCEQLCAECTKHGLVACPKPVGTTGFGRDMDSGDVNHRNTMEWVKWTPELAAQIARKKRAIQRKFRTIPITNQEKVAVLRDAQAEALAKEMK